MPLYEFECECGKRKELITSFKTTSIECEDCGKDMKRLISLSSFKFSLLNPPASISFEQSTCSNHSKAILLPVPPKTSTKASTK